MPSTTAFAAPEASKEIPVLAYSHDGSSPPEYAMIELNGNLVPPVEFPPKDTCVQVFGKDRTVELGKLYRNGPEKASVESNSFQRSWAQVNADLYLCSQRHERRKKTSQQSI